MWIGRKPNGEIYGAWTSKQPEDADHPGLEEVADTHPDLVAFQKRPAPGQGRKTVEERLDALEAKVK